MDNYYYNGTVIIDTDEMYVEVEVHAEAHGYYIEGDSFGCGCEPPDGDFEIDKIEYISATTYDEEGNASSVKITDKIKEIVKSKLYEEDFEVSEPDYDDCYED